MSGSVSVRVTYGGGEINASWQLALCRLRYISGLVMSTMESFKRGTDFSNLSAGNAKRKSVGEHHCEIKIAAA